MIPNTKNSMNPNIILQRQEIALYIYDLWTSGGSDESGLAYPILDGRIESLGFYVSFADWDENATVSNITLKSKTIDCYDCQDLTYQQFIERYMIPNKPVIIRGLTEHWDVSQHWVNEDGEPHVAALAKIAADDIADVHVQSEPGFPEARPRCEKWMIRDYVQWWMDHKNDPKSQLLYLKDYTFSARHPHYDAYEWPHYFQDDWLNECTKNSYRFVYLGPKGTSTRLHADVLCSFSWSSNVCGIKRWYLIPPEQTYLLYDVFSRRLASHLHCTDTTMYPGLEKAKRVAIEWIQHPGETIFVPSGWHHTVENLAPTLSINHNWLNASNIRWSWCKLRKELEGLTSSVTQTSLEQSTSSNASSQVGEDLRLLWTMLWAKINQFLKMECSSMVKYNLQACLQILLQINDIILSGKDQGLNDHYDCQAGVLIQKIENYLTCLDISSYENISTDFVK
jgi:Cupin-like domain